MVGDRDRIGHALAVARSVGLCRRCDRDRIRRSDRGDGRRAAGGRALGRRSRVTIVDDRADAGLEARIDQHAQVYRSAAASRN